MQVSGPVQGVSTISRRRRLEVLAAIAALVVLAAVVLMVSLGPLATSGGGAEDANPKSAGADSAVYYPPTPGKAASLYYPRPHGKVAKSNAAGAGSSAVVHDDPWNLNPN